MNISQLSLINKAFAIKSVMEFTDDMEKTLIKIKQRTAEVERKDQENEELFKELQDMPLDLEGLEELEEPYLKLEQHFREIASKRPPVFKIHFSFEEFKKAIRKIIPQSSIFFNKLKNNPRFAAPIIKSVMEFTDDMEKTLIKIKQRTAEVERKDQENEELFKELQDMPLDLEGLEELEEPYLKLEQHFREIASKRPPVFKIHYSFEEFKKAIRKIIPDCNQVVPKSTRKQIEIPIQESSLLETDMVQSEQQFDQSLALQTQALQTENELSNKAPEMKLDHYYPEDFEKAISKLVPKSTSKQIKCFD